VITIRPPRLALATLAAAVMLALHGSRAPSAAAAVAADQNLTVRITSPMGRTGSFGAVRVVAQVSGAAEPLTPPPVVTFFVDSIPIGEDIDGPPFAVEWIDENPFERREISVTVSDNRHREASDRVFLEPFEITEVSEVSSVLLEATVEDAKGQRVTTLDAEGFALSENGEPQSLDMVRADVLPATYLLLIDSSQSMSRRLDFVKEAARRLLAYLRPEDRVLVVPFSRQLGAVTGPTSDHQTILDAIGAIRATGGTAIVDSVAQAAALLADLPGRHAVILLTDGYDEHSEHDGRDALDALKRSQTTAYVVGIGGVAGVSIKGERFLKDLAKQTAGRAFFPYRETELAAVHDHIADDVRHRYLLSYTPTNQRHDGTWRAIVLKTAHDEWTVRARPGYFAPEPPPVRALLEFTVTDADNRYLDVARDDLAITEDGVAQKIESFQEAVAPVSIILTLDQSGSMRRATEAVKEAAHRFVATLRPTDALGVSLFADSATLTQDLTKNRDEASDAIDQYLAKGGTALYDALGNALERLRRVEGRRALVVLTDGRDENDAGTAAGSVRPFNEVLRLAQETDVTVFAIGLGANVDRQHLETLATTTGGLALFPSDVAALDGEYQRIVENLRRRYEVSYISTNAKRNGAWRNVTIESQTPRTTVRSRGGYYAPDDGK
jgi:Ca-activated chloride channel family protein